jgi:predicted phosphodiesterase
MAAPKSPKRIIAEEYDLRFPNTPTLTLSRKLFKENNLIYNDVEDARSSIRVSRGQNGDRNRIATRHKAEDLKYNYNPFKLPESQAEDRQPYVLPVGCNNILVISDLHIPYHNVPAITAAFQYGQNKNVNTVFINGDLVDFCLISRFEKNPKKRSVKYELDATRAVLDSIREAFPTQSIYFIKGNHDIRLEAYLRVKAPEILDMDEFQLESLLQLNKYQIKIIDDNILVKAGMLSITHGHHVMRGFFAPVNSARGLYMKAKQSTIIGHVHKVSEHTETNMDGEMTTTWSTGCLCELKPDYSPLVSNYSHGFAHVVVHPDKTFSVTNKRIYNGKIL